jgi:hypothetical protein
MVWATVLVLAIVLKVLEPDNVKTDVPVRPPIVKLL